jgi:hypothetical protein
MKTFYSVDFAYPSSPDAKRFHARHGCWTVSKTTIDGNTAKTVTLSGGYATQDAALKAARSLSPEEIRYATAAQVISEKAQRNTVGFSSTL